MPTIWFFIVIDAFLHSLFNRDGLKTSACGQNHLGFRLLFDFHFCFGVQVTPTHLTASKPNQNKSPSASGEFSNAQLTADIEGN